MRAFSKLSARKVNWPRDWLKVGQNRDCRPGPKGLELKWKAMDFVCRGGSAKESLLRMRSSSASGQRKTQDNRIGLQVHQKRSKVHRRLDDRGLPD